MTTSYDPNIVIQAAEEKLAVNDLAAGQTLFQSALLNWVDDAQFSAVTDKDQLQEAIATLWIAYAQFLQKAKQFKSATEAYEQAVACPVGSLVGRVWLDYARFLEERGKLRSAQKVYLRALVDDNGGKVQDEQDRDLLWNEFLEMMKTNKPDLTLQALKQAVEEEHLMGDADGDQRPQKVSSGGADTDDDDNMYDDLLPNPKRPRLDNRSAPKIKQEDNSEESRTHVVTASDVKTEETALEDIIQDAKSDPQFLAAWMVRDGDGQPQAPEVALFEAAPPKLSDPTGKDLLGEELALQLVQRILGATGSVILQTCRGLWMMKALTERVWHKRLNDLDETIKEELETLQQRLDERLSVAGKAEAAVRLVNDGERRAFQENCNTQRQKLLNDMAWDFRRLLWVQQQFLTKLKIPGFHGTSVDGAELWYQARICSYLHSAFFLRQRIGEEAHVKMLKSQESRLKQLIEDQPMMVATGGTGNRMTGSSPKFSSTSTRLSPTPMQGGGRLSPTRNSPVPNFHMQPPMQGNLPPPPQQVYQRMPPQMPQQYGGMPMPPGAIPGYPPLQQMYPPPHPAYPNMQQMPPNYNPQLPYHQQQPPPQNPPYY
jgi:tetratricopeptide (TPR) repeat protein